jgi:hypothetical protein
MGNGNSFNRAQVHTQVPPNANYPPQHIPAQMAEQYRTHPYPMPPIAELLNDPTWGYTNVNEDMDSGNLGDFDVNAVSSISMLFGVVADG